MDLKTQKNKNVSSDEYFTPWELFSLLGQFDTDPCTSKNRPFDTAKIHYTREEDGLAKEWKGVVWLNPPYSSSLLNAFVKRLSEHGSGMALLVNRIDNLLFQETIFPHAASMYVLRKRVKFISPDGQRKSPMFGSLLIAFGEECDRRLRDLAVEGKYIKLN